MNYVSKNKQNPELPAWRKLLNFALLFGFIGSMFGIVISASIGKAEYSILLFGLCFLFIGILAVLSSKLTDRNAFILIFPVLGICITGLSCYHLANPKEDIWRYALLAGVGMMLFLAAVMGLSVPIYAAYIEQKFTETVSALCVDLKEDVTRTDLSNGPNKVTVYCPIYQFHFLGRDYTVSENTYYSNMGIPKVGESRELLINPRNPEEFYVKKRGLFWGNLLFVVVALIFSAAMAYAYYINYMG